MIVEIKTEGLSYYEAEEVVGLLVKLNLLVKEPLTITSDNSNMDNSISESLSLWV